VVAAGLFLALRQVERRLPALALLNSRAVPVVWRGRARQEAVRAVAEPLVLEPMAVQAVRQLQLTLEPLAAAGRAMAPRGLLLV
jgi:hypothetical protein